MEKRWALFGGPEELLGQVEDFQKNEALLLALLWPSSLNQPVSDGI